MDNPFKHGKEVLGDAFCNRKNEIKNLLQDIHSGQNVIIYSPRRYGKTSLIKEVLRRAAKEKIHGIYVDLYPVLRESDFIDIYSKAIAKSLTSWPIKKVMTTLKDIFFSIRPKVSMNQDGSFDFSIEQFQNTSAMLEDVAEAAKKCSKQTGKKVVVVFDEFQQIGFFGTDKLEKQLRGIIQTHQNVSYVFMGSKKHLFSNMFSNPNKPFYKAGKHLPLKKIHKDEWINFIANRFKASKKSIPEKLINEIVDTAECHPYYIQCICSIVWMLSKGTINRANVDKALSNIIIQESAIFLGLWDELSPVQRKTLHMIADSGKTSKIYSAEIQTKYGLAPTTVQKTIKTLIAKDILDKTNGSYEITDVFFKIWLLGYFVSQNK